MAQEEQIAFRPDIFAGEVSLLFADIENSAALWDRAPEKMPAALARHERLLREIISLHGGAAVKMIGDGMHAAFADAADAMRAAVEIGRAYRTPDSETGLDLRTRCAVHCGPAGQHDRDDFAKTVNLATRLTGAAHGGQLLASAAAASSVVSCLPEDISLIELGEVRLRGLSNPETAFQICHGELPAHFPPLRSHKLPPNNLPRARNLFIGRGSTVHEVAVY